MPCNDSRPAVRSKYEYDTRQDEMTYEKTIKNQHDSDKVSLRKADFAAILCGILGSCNTKQRNIMLCRVDWKEVGLPETVVKDWYLARVAKDEKRIRKEALAKLTDKEKKVLGR